MKVNPLYYIPATAQELYYGGEQAKKKYRQVGINIMGMPFPEGDDLAENIRRKYRRHMIVAFTFAFIAMAAAIGFALSEEMPQPAAERVMWATFGATIVCAVFVFAESFYIIHLQKKIVRHFLKTYRPVCAENEDAEGLEVYGSALLDTERSSYIFADQDGEKTILDSWICLYCGENFTADAVRDFNDMGNALCPCCRKPGVTVRIPYQDFDSKVLSYARKAMGESDNNNR